MSYIHRQLNGLSPEVKTYSRRSPLEIEEHEVDYIGECSAMNEHRGKFVSFREEIVPCKNCRVRVLSGPPRSTRGARWRRRR